MNKFIAFITFLCLIAGCHPGLGAGSKKSSANSVNSNLVSNGGGSQLPSGFQSNSQPSGSQSSTPAVSSPQKGENLYEKYSALLTEAKVSYANSLFDSVRLRCDEQIIDWTLHVLDVSYNKVAFKPSEAGGGMSGFKVTPESADELLAVLLAENEPCTIPGFIKRIEGIVIEKTDSPSTEIGNILSLMQALHHDLQTKFVTP